jgi:hypothetical protein
MMTTRRNERIEFNPQKYLLGDLIKGNVKQPESHELTQQWAIRS